MELQEKTIHMDVGDFDIKDFIDKLPNDFFSSLDDKDKFVHTMIAEQGIAFKRLFELVNAYDRRLRNRVFFLELVIGFQAVLGVMAVAFGG